MTSGSVLLRTINNVSELKNIEPPPVGGVHMTELPRNFEPGVSEAVLRFKEISGKA